MLGVYHDDPALPTIRSQIYHLSLSSDNISRDIDILSGGLMVYQQAVSLFCLRMINTEINGNSKSISSKGLFRDNKLIPSSNWFAGKESADVIEGSGFMYDHLTWNDVSQITLEVVFKTSTLTCFFNQNDICEAVYLFLTDNKDLMKYMSHCVKTYTYDFLLDGWTTDKCHISICRSENQGCFLLILPLKKIL